MKHLSVNEIVQSKDSLFGVEVCVHGILTYSEKDVLIFHWPKSERNEKYSDAVWVHTGDGVFGFNKKTLLRISGKRVIVRGMITKYNAVFPDDPGAYWSTHLYAKELTELKKWNTAHGISDI